LEIRIDPPASDEERAAIAQALAALSAPEDGRGAWWRAGLAENVEPEDEPA
jgi:hypothetical protein